MQPDELLARRYPGPRAESKRRILQCALGLFNEHGIEATTIELIRADSEMSVGSIYHHFGNKEGVLAALYLAALEDQAQLREQYLQAAQTTQALVQALVFSYIDWVVAHPNWARFQYQARFSLSKSPLGDSLKSANQARNAQLRTWFAQHNSDQVLIDLPTELIPSLIIGPAESYCRAWFSNRVRHSPETYRVHLAEAAWRAVARAQ